MLSDLNGVVTKIQNISISDERAEKLIEEAVLLTGMEIRNQFRQLRKNELAIGGGILTST